MSYLDSYYTPSPLADKLVGYVDVDDVESIIDFCVGDGMLLKAASKRFPMAKLFGIDISESVITNLIENDFSAELRTCDFRDDNKLSNIKFLQSRTFDLIMLNPPFTCKGSVIEKIRLNEIDFKVSTAMFFLMKTLNFLSPIGGVYAVLPISCVYSNKDKKAWQYLQKEYNACVLEETDRVYFSKKCSPNVALVYVGNYINSNLLRKKDSYISGLNILSVIRGSVRMQNLVFCKKKEAEFLIHTTNIQKGKLVNLKKVQVERQRIISGNGVVIPRVCNPNPNKVAILNGKTSYVLSDCVILLKTKTLEDSKAVRENILLNWEKFASMYKGTAAQYTTVERTKCLFGMV